MSATRDKLTILFPFQDRVEYRSLSDETMHDLGLDALCQAVTADGKEQALLMQVLRSVTPDPEVARYRAEVFDDLYHHPEIREKLLSLLDHVKFLNDFGAVRRSSDEGVGVWDLIHRLDELRDYIATVEAMEECLREASLQSQGLRELRAGIHAIWEDSGFDGLKQDIAALKATTDSVKSVTIGMNLNERFEPVQAGLVSVNSKPFSRSNLIQHFADALVRREAIRGTDEWDGSMNWQPADSGNSFLADKVNEIAGTTVRMRNPLLAMTLSSVPDSDGGREIPRTMDSALTHTLSSLVRKLREVLNRHAAISIREVSDLIPELVFYVRWAEYWQKLTAAGWPCCKPQPGESAEQGMKARGFYNLKLTQVESPASTVRNDLTFGAEGRVYLLTGANRGGKTTVTQAVGQLFLMAQSGLYVAAEEFSYAPVDGVYTHFPADEDKTLDLGRLGEECQRFRELFQACSESSLLLLNESFSTTSFEEGYYIATDAVKAIAHRGIRCIYNTHMHKLAQDLTQEGGGSLKEVRSLIVRSQGRQRSFQIEVAPPEGSSYARDIAEKYGVTYDCLLEKA
ncbi:MAG: DNA mismatch repair protein [Clostridia bacterium]|nr:DNA mismatch repair protein [Clostridia bacterium]